MELVDFLRQTQAEVREAIGANLVHPEADYPYGELVFAEIVMQHMSEIGMTFEPVVCHYSARVGNANLRLSGYAISEDADQIDLFVSLYGGVEDVTPIADSETKTAAEQCLRFFKRCAEGKLAAQIDESNDAYPFVLTIQGCYSDLDQIRIYVLTDRKAKAKNFKPREVGQKVIKLEVMDIERLHRHLSEGKPRDEIVVNFEEVCGSALPCVYVPDVLGEKGDYDCILTVFPGEALRFVYDKYGDRLLEANVRSFLSTTKKVNKGIRETLKTTPEHFMAYNNGIVVIADEIVLGMTPEGMQGIRWMKGMQIVNGGQTTASLYFTKRKSPEVDLSRVRVVAKIIKLRSSDLIAEEELVSSISRYANSQTAVRQADLSANKPFHVEIEKLSNTVFCPDGTSRWFYERAAGSYNVFLAREGTTPAKLKHIKDSIPTSRKISKTDLAKFLNAWNQKPYLVSRGAEKNFIEFMKEIEDSNGQSTIFQPDINFYKQLIAKAILFKVSQKLVRPMFLAFQANVTAYLVSVSSNMIGKSLDLGKIWQNQDLSHKLRQQLQAWASEVHDVLHKSANGRMVSEWAKKEECWDIVRCTIYSNPIDGIPEIATGVGITGNVENTLH